MTTQPTDTEGLEQRLATELRHTLKLVPQSQRELFVAELARWYQRATPPLPESNDGAGEPLSEVFHDNAADATAELEAKHPTPPAPSVPTVGGELKGTPEYDARLIDRNGDPIVSDILNIIDVERTRYAVAQAVAKYIATRQLSADEARQEGRDSVGQDMAHSLGKNDSLEIWSYIRHDERIWIAWYRVKGNDPSKQIHGEGKTIAEALERLAALRTDKDREVA